MFLTALGGQGQPLTALDDALIALMFFAATPTPVEGVGWDLIWLC